MASLGYNELRPCILFWNNPALCWLTYIIMVIADVLAPSRCQFISNHHGDSPVTMESHKSYLAAEILHYKFTALVILKLFQLKYQFRKHKTIFAFSTISQHGTGIWNPSLWKTRTCSSFIAHSMFSDDLVIYGTSTSAATLIDLLSNL